MSESFGLTKEGIVFRYPRSAQLVEARLAERQADDVLVRTVVSLVSTGTEIIAFRQAFAADSHWAAYAKLPFHPGYACVGEVVGAGHGEGALEIGTRVIVERPHASFHVVAPGECLPIPDSVKSEDAVWFTLAQIAFRGFWASNQRVGGSIVIVGAGPVGQMAVRWASVAGLGRIAVVDPVRERLSHALAGGAHLVFEAELHEVAADQLGRDGIASAVIDTTGNPRVFADVLGKAHAFGRVVLLGDAPWPHEQCLTSDLLLKGLEVVGAFGGHERDGWGNQRVRTLFLELLRDRRLSVDGLISHRFEPADCQDAYDLLATSRQTTMGVAFSWPHEPDSAAPADRARP